jgi:hypothetical protein
MSDFLQFHAVPLGSIWMAADGGNYGYLVVGRSKTTFDLIVKPFNSEGWCDGPDTIDYFKMQYRYQWEA